MRKIIHKILFVLLSISLMFTMLSGCAKEETTKPVMPSEQNTNKSETTVLTEPEKIDIKYENLSFIKKQKTDEFSYSGYSLFVEEKVSNVEQIIDSTEKVIKTAHERTMEYLFPDGISEYTVLETIDTSKSIILKGKVNNFNFATIYSKEAIANPRNPNITHFEISFYVEVDGDTSYIDSLIEEFK